MTFVLTAAVVILFVLVRDLRRRLRLAEVAIAELRRRADAAPPADRLAAAAPVGAVEPAVVSDPGPALPSQLPASEPTERRQPWRWRWRWRQGSPVAARRGLVAVGFEELFGRRLPIWAGGITLGVAGILLVKYSIDLGLLSPTVRVVLGAGFGALLIAGAEAARRQADRVHDPRVAQALAGSGVTSLFATIVAAANLYALIGPFTAFVGLAAVTGLSIALALRFGAPSALLGLLGGLAAPALVESGEANVPLLSVYLAMTVAALAALSLRRRWAWLGIGAMLGGAGWSLVLIAGGALGLAATLSVGLLVVALGIAVPMLAFAGPRTAVVQSVAAVVAAAQMALLVSLGGFAMLHWGLFGLLSLALLWLAGRVAALRTAAATGLALGLLLAALWPAPAPGELALILAGLTGLYGGAGLLRLWRTHGGALDAAQVAAAAVGSVVVAVFHLRLPDGSGDGALALLALAAAALPASGAALGWSRPERLADPRFATLAAACAVLLASAVALGLPGRALAPALAVLAAGLLALARGAGDRRLEAPSLSFLVAAALALVAIGDGPGEFLRLFGAGGEGSLIGAVLRWLPVTVAAGFLAARLTLGRTRVPLQIAATLLAYGVTAQVVPAPWLASASAAGLLALAEAQRARAASSIKPALATALGLVALWGLAPLALWSAAGLRSLGGVPVLANALPAGDDALRALALPSVLAAAALVRSPAHVGGAERRGAWVLVALLATGGVHTLYKQLFGLESAGDFVRLGLAERTIWGALLVGAAWAAMRLPRLAPTPAPARLALTFAAAAVAHAAFYSFLLFNPLWSDQAVGSLPLANWLLPAGAVAFAALALIARAPGMQTPPRRTVIDAARMAVILLVAFASLRQLFAGSRFAHVPVTAGESIAWSVLAITLALGFLVWGIRGKARAWRVGSLALMLVAVAKVFLVDASGLPGLMRIGSFLALGFSLIGLGWLYSRFLRADVRPAADPP